MSNKALETISNDTDLIAFDEGKVALIKRMIAPTATPDELELFLHQCKRTGLDPLAKQIYFQKYQTKRGPQVTIITGIDGYRLVADRTGRYAGSDAPIFEDSVQQTRYNKVFTAPFKAIVTVYKFVSGQRCAFTAVAYWAEYWPDDKKGSMWEKMPCTMLAKCAEALALRKAFPADLSGVYTREEMAQSQFEDVPFEVVNTTPPTVKKELPPVLTVVDDDANDDLFPEEEPVKKVETPNTIPDNMNLADFANWYAKQSERYTNNIHVVGALKQLDPNVGVNFKNRSIEDYISFLETRD